jgi:hypothetical protein
MTKTSTNIIFEITDKFGADEKPELMKALKSLKTSVKYENYLAFRKRLLPVTDFKIFKEIR